MRAEELALASLFAAAIGRADGGAARRQIAAALEAHDWRTALDDLHEALGGRPFGAAERERRAS